MRVWLWIVRVWQLWIGEGVVVDSEGVDRWDVKWCHVLGRLVIRKGLSLEWFAYCQSHGICTYILVVTSHEGGVKYVCVLQSQCTISCFN